MQMDTNSDGSVSFDEFATNEKERRGADFDEAKAKRKFDQTDKDGTISKEEMDKAPTGKRK